MVSPEGTWTAQEPAGTPFCIDFGPNFGWILEKFSKKVGILITKIDCHSVKFLDDDTTLVSTEKIF